MKPVGNLALFGGSFNPPHRGHHEIMRHLYNDSKINTILISPSYNHPYQKKSISYHHRLEMCRELVSEFSEKVYVTEIEAEVEEKYSFTIEVVKKLKTLYLCDRFFLVLGSDCKHDLKNWHRFEDLKKEVEFYFIPRSGFEDSKFMNISSSEIRRLIREGLSWENFVPDKIAHYIKRHELYEEKS